jgi:hypothetical protein
LLVLSLVLPACTQFQSNRSYLTEMEHDDSSYFEPGEDFPVMVGDTGRTWRSNKELRSRTPASSEDLADRRTRSTLNSELKRLEEAQSETSMAQYEKVEKKFNNASEKIYFLKLSPAERQDYLESRGFSQSPTQTVRDRIQNANQRFHERSSGISFGMSKDDVRYNYGQPVRVEVAGNPSNENERWVYNLNGATKYIYFEGGRVEGWE